MLRYCSSTTISARAPGKRAAADSASARSIACFVCNADVTKSRTITRTDVRSTLAVSVYGCTKPSWPSVVSGDRSRGRLSMNAAATLMVFTMRSFA